MSIIGTGIAGKQRTHASASKVRMLSAPRKDIEY